MKADKDLYRELRQLTCEQLWREEVPRFNRAKQRERMERVAVIRAVGVVFAGTAPAGMREEARAWLRALLQDPVEKIRRYAMNALPKIGAGEGEEKELLSLLQKPAGDREKKFVGRALDKIGGETTLAAVSAEPGLLPQTEQKVKAALARCEQPGTVKMTAPISPLPDLRIQLRCRKGLEKILREEAAEFIGKRGRFRIAGVEPRVVTLVPVSEFTLADLYAMRCFATAGFLLGRVRDDGSSPVEELANIIASPRSRTLFELLSEGPPRYRLDFAGKGHQRAAVRDVANRAYALCPEILNDPRGAPWAVDVHPVPGGSIVELRPKFAPDPRLGYRKDDVAAASHPPLAAAMARLAGPHKSEIAWDPFCGSGVELIERAMLGGVSRIIGTDTSAGALEAAKQNILAAQLDHVDAVLDCRDFRECADVPGLGRASVTLVITNPPMGRRIRVPNLRGLIAEFLDVASAALKPGGRLVFVNPLRLEPRDRSLKREFREIVDLGGYDGRLEKYVKRL